MTEAEGYTPTLSFGEEAPAAPAVDLSFSSQSAGAAQAPELNESALTPEEREQMETFAGQIDLRNTNAILEYGSSAQRKLADFSESTLERVRTKDMGETGKLITDLVTELKDFEVEENDGKAKKFFKKKGNQVNAIKARYSSIEKNVDVIVKALQDHQVQLLKDIDLLERMYDLNQGYFKELTMYILAGKKALEKARTVDLVSLQQKAEQSGLPEDAQAAKDYAAMCDRFEKKIYDLELTRTISLQTAPQIRLVQSSDSVMAEKIQSTLVNTIPLWKNQMVIALGIEHSNQAAAAQREVNEVTNALLQKNAEALKTATVESAKESERGIVDIETLQKTNASLIETLDSVKQITEEGRTKRREAETELSRIEEELKAKLLEMSKQ